MDGELAKFLTYPSLNDGSGKSDVRMTAFSQPVSCKLQNSKNQTRKP
jgi:hypothetical protein